MQDLVWWNPKKPKIKTTQNPELPKPPNPLNCHLQENLNFSALLKKSSSLWHFHSFLLTFDAIPPRNNLRFWSICDLPFYLFLFLLIMATLSSTHKSKIIVTYGLSRNDMLLYWTEFSRNHIVCQVKTILVHAIKSMIRVSESHSWYRKVYTE